ncbi:MAG TPA: fibronectin type III domain-containing protein, partial [Chitinophaga sp.]|uniref:fibronectin type III domain-containing protein n=1 Tax=Chitinophaga sp. TaxID=1869181 RepID=UPI002BFC9919
VNQVVVTRDTSDTRHATISWTKDKNATGYVVYYGLAPDALYTAVMTYGSNKLELTGLNRDTPYFFRIDAFNECGIRKGK